MMLAADETGLTDLRFDGQKHAGRLSADMCRSGEVPVFAQTRAWLDMYFSGKEPDFTPALHLIGSDFQRAVWDILLTIPYACTMTYGEIAALLAERRGIAAMSAQAVGGAVGHNRIGVIVPCHRVMGAKGNLTGYAAGISRKIFLLQLEGLDTGKMHMPRKGHARQGRTNKKARP